MLPVLQRRCSQSFFPLGGGRRGADRLGSTLKRNDYEFSHLSLNIFSAPGCVGGKGSYSGSIMTFHYVAAFWISVCLTSAAHCLLNELIPTSPFCYLFIQAAEIACEETSWVCLSGLGKIPFKCTERFQRLKHALVWAYAIKTILGKFLGFKLWYPFRGHKIGVFRASLSQNI